MPAGLGLPELLIIFALLLLLFGAKRLPEMGRSLGRGMREFKEAVTGSDDAPERGAELPSRATVTPPPPPPAAPAPPSETERVSS
ncbi:MAG TPA: twin-arginine translocase TatA/TatE family subunit [Actinomycetota bacterium]|nr:twin-arginine translocase TatA/TatE family subunit [Actinomycetota bacterium]